ncbi:MAG: adenylosuccinate synthetase, partial [Methanotrichaceae archaeon]|nr:adenylosuccinate synthetase [Methanotrichaceae archaeon]
MFTILTGAQFGDEGKGKIIDLLAENYDIVVRFQGGDNAGHTVVVGGKKYKLHLVPSGAIFGRRLLIGPGVVLNPRVLWSEIQALESEGIKVDLGVDARTSIIMPYHIELDGLREKARTEKIGTTNRGIGFAYVDKVAREEVQMEDLTDPALLEAKLKEIGPAKEKAIADMGGDPSVVRAGIDEYLEIGQRLKDNVVDV